VLTGFNTDIEYEGVTYHVQTEDRGAANPLIESLVYVKGEILANRRTDYTNLLEAGADRAALQILMDRQHRTIVDAIRSGRIDLLTAPEIAGASDTTVSRRPLVTGGRPGGPINAARRSERTLDEVIADWLAEQQRGEQVRLRVVGADDLTFGCHFELKVNITMTPGDEAVVGARVLARFLSTALKPVLLAEGTSDDSGNVEIAGDVPVVDKGQGLMVLSVQHPRGNDELKFLVKR
jgi:hypothetical protein